MAFFLVLSGGFFDAYTYVCRDGVFANAQTGNIVMFGISAAKMNLNASVLYLIPILAFVAGVFLSEVMKRKSSSAENCSKFVLFVEVLILVGVAFIPQELNMLANVLISFVCAMQVNTFRKWHANGFATTMCTGNLRTATELFNRSIFERDFSLLRKSLGYFAIIVIFVFGAILGFLATNFFAEKAVLFASAMVFLTLLRIIRG